MVNINSSSSVKDNNHVELPKTGSTTATASPISSDSEVKSRSAATTVSPLAQQLSEAAERAAVRDSTLNMRELAKTALSILNKIGDRSDVYKRERFDAEIPKTDDPVLLTRAKQATAFVNGKGPNPFAGMSREQLALITYDEGGPFTINERRAASYEAGVQESAWRKVIVAKSQEVYHRTGNSNGDGVALKMLEHYRSLPLIEQSQYPRDYEAQLTRLAEQVPEQLEPADLLTLLNKWAKTSPLHSMASGADVSVPNNGDISDATLQARIEENKNIDGNESDDVIDPAARENFKKQ